MIYHSEASHQYMTSMNVINYDSIESLSTSSDIAQLQRDAIGRELRISSNISKSQLILALAKTRLLLVTLARCLIPAILDLKQVL